MTNPWVALGMTALAAYVVLRMVIVKRGKEPPRWFMLFEIKPQYRDEYVLEPGNTGESRLPASLGGVNWADAPLPWRGHLCWVQTKYVGRNAVSAVRCACGAWSRDGGKTWFNRNIRRKWSRQYRGRHRD